MNIQLIKNKPFVRSIFNKINDLILDQAHTLTFEKKIINDIYKEFKLLKLKWKSISGGSGQSKLLNDLESKFMIINISESEQQNDTKIQSTNDFNQELDASVSKKASKSSALNSFKSR